MIHSLISSKCKTFFSFHLSQTTGYLSTPDKKAAGFLETSVNFFQTTSRHMPLHITLCGHRRENRISHTIVLLLYIIPWQSYTAHYYFLQLLIIYFTAGSPSISNPPLPTLFVSSYTFLLSASVLSSYILLSCYHPPCINIPYFHPPQIHLPLHLSLCFSPPTCSLQIPVCHHSFLGFTYIYFHMYVPPASSNS